MVIENSLESSVLGFPKESCAIWGKTVKFAAAGPAEPILVFETRQPKTDENGVPLFTVPVFAAGSGVKDSITIKVAGEVKGLGEFTIVKITNLIAST